GEVEPGAGVRAAPREEEGRGRQPLWGRPTRHFGRLPRGDAPPAERWAEASEIRERLRQMLQSLAPPAGAGGRLEIEPLRTAAFLAPEGDMHPEVSVSARVFHGEDYFAEVTEGEEKRVYAGGRRLAEMGLKERRHPLR